MQKAIYIPEDYEDYWDKLEKIANKENRSVSYLVNRAIKKYIENTDQRR
ncbi:MAG: ribbon-helix-helix protein, CopG family [archaeon]